MKKIASILLFGLFALHISSCCQLLYLADMVCKKLATAIPTVQTGQAFALVTIIKNVAESAKLCETEPAGASNTKYQVRYRADENKPWEDASFNNNGQQTFEVFVDTDPLEPDQDTGFEPSFKMNIPGQYRFEGFADGKKNVNERDENNNGNNAEGSLNGKGIEPSNVVIVTVVASPDYKPDNDEKPFVTYLGHKKLW